MRPTIAVATAAGLLAVTAPAQAHVTVQPAEATIGAFARFVVRVPNERSDAATTKIRVEFPALAFVSFEPKAGWERDVEMTELEEPIEAFGQEITEAVGSATWSGGRIGVGEFGEFGFSAKMPDAEESLSFAAFQTYDSGEVVEWTGVPDSEEPAARLHVYDIGAAEDEGQLAVLARIDGRLATLEEEAEGTDLGTWLGAIATVLALAALALALRGGRGAAEG